ncbi:TolC family protein [Polyangium aurulentum]|uniref:TolC family protein n=1 Tax=Polyangium aurulentum TaxID=2567896 RepID=UPI00146AC920|nr:TolC family protein [Polyangium aurulentum]UQA58797.1 TolC family protein [Polyangium aurulentum]
MTPIPRKRVIRASAIVAALATLSFSNGANATEPRVAFAATVPSRPAPDTAHDPPMAERFPSLERAMELARERAPSVVSARAGVGVARASHRGARLAPIDNPYLEVFVDRGLQRATKDVTVQANLWLPIEMSGQRARRLDEADALVAWQQTRFDSTRLVAAGDAVRAYGAALVAAARVQTVEEIVRDALAEAEVYSQRLAAGDATLQDDKLASMEHARYVVMREESQADLTRALVELSRATGRMFTPPDAVSVAPPPPAGHLGGSAAARVADRSPHVATSTREATYYARAKERAALEAHPPVNLIVSAGRGDLGEPRFGGGFSWTFPVLRRNQGEQARADAERARALAEADVKRRIVAQTLDGLTRERAEVRRAREVLETLAEPAAQASVDAAVATRAAGKGEMLRVLTARRDLALLRLRRLELIAREWSIVGDIVALTGEMP